MNTSAGRFDPVGVDDLYVKRPSHTKRRLGHQLADAALGELCRILTYETSDHGDEPAVVDRFFPSSTTYSDGDVAGLGPETRTEPGTRRR